MMFVVQIKLATLPPLHSPAGKGDRVKRWLRRAKSVQYVEQNTNTKLGYYEVFRFIISEFFIKIIFERSEKISTFN